MVPVIIITTFTPPLAAGWAKVVMFEAVIMVLISVFNPTL